MAWLIKGMGYPIAWIVPPGRDGEMDIIAHGDPLSCVCPHQSVAVHLAQRHPVAAVVVVALAVKVVEDFARVVPAGDSSNAGIGG